MSELVHELIHRTARTSGESIALKHGRGLLSYGALDEAVRAAARGLIGLGVDRGERIAIYLEKRMETVIAMFGAAAAGAVYVPVNPLLKPQQAAYIMRDCNVRVLVTSPERLRALADALGECHDLRHIVLTEGTGVAPDGFSQRLAQRLVGWNALLDDGARSGRACHRVIDGDMAAILYTSGSTGMPKGVVLSHRNIVTGAKSVSSYLENRPEDRILCVLPFSFDYGMSQLTTAFNVG
ncbi:MAG: AMP-binding protein, partial [Alphaproteobacteria bacterium]